MSTTVYMVSPHFSSKELECKHCGRLEIDPILPPALEDLRRTVRELTGEDVRLGVNSAYRCAVHNKAIGSQPTSQHIKGKAADIRPIGTSLRRLYDAALLTPAFHEGGIGVYPEAGFIHVDIGPKRRWGFVGGRMTSLEEALRRLH